MRDYLFPAAVIIAAIIQASAALFIAFKKRDRENKTGTNGAAHS